MRTVICLSVLVPLLLTAGMSLPPRSVRAAAQKPTGQPWCQVTNGRAAGPLTAVGPYGGTAVVDSHCIPSVGWYAPLGGQLTPNLDGLGLSPVVAAGNGEAYVLHSAPEGRGVLEKVTDSGQVLWAMDVPRSGQLQGNGNLLVAGDSIVDPKTRHIAPIPSTLSERYPGCEQRGENPR